MSRKFFRNDRGINLGTGTSDPTDAIAGSFYFNIITGKLRIFNGTAWSNVGAGSTGFGDVDSMFVDSAEQSVLADYTQSGLEIITQAGLVHNDVAFRLIHQSSGSRSFKKTLATDAKFRGKNMTLALDVRSSALQANLTIEVRCETNSTNLLPATQIQTDSFALSCTTTSGSQTLAPLPLAEYSSVRIGMSVTGPGIPTGTSVQSKNDTTRVVTLSAAATASATANLRYSGLISKRYFTFDIPDNCTSISWTISALAETNAPESYFDDITAYVSKNSIVNTTYNATEWVLFPMTPSSVGGTAPTKGTIVRDKAWWRRQGDSIEIRWEYEQSSSGTAGTGTTYLFPIPSGVPGADLTKISASATSQAENDIGRGFLNTTGDGFTQQTNALRAFLYSSTHFGIYVASSSGGQVLNQGYIAGVGTVPIFNSYPNLVLSLTVSIPISGWTAFSNSTTTLSQYFARKIAIIRDEKPSGTPGGTFTSGAYQTRVLNTLVDPSGVVTSLSANTFTLPAGHYRIRAAAPTYNTNLSKIKLRNTTDSTDVIVGSSIYCGTSTLGEATLSGTFLISSPKSFQIMHRGNLTTPSNGLGEAAGFGDVEVYATVELERLD